MGVDLDLDLERLAKRDGVVERHRADLPAEHEGIGIAVRGGMLIDGLKIRRKDREESYGV